ncbi:serine hydrolase domain-containing protein [Serratia nevei]|uniref:serine hydrolase domain-containing protein n=1 Tax=Serratia nevei TaxID=2703794 RepID=UPI003FA6B078
MKHKQLSNSRISDTIDTAHDEKRIVGAVVLVARRGEVVYHRASGWADRESAHPMREDAIFRFASVTKPLVAAATMRLVEQGVIALEQPVTRWLPNFRPRLPNRTEPVITLYHLLTHTSGLSYRFLESEGSDYHKLGISDGMEQPGLLLDENLRRLAAARLAFEPGTQWRYSLGLDVLGAVLEQATATSLPKLVSELVTAPLGMRDTAFVVADRKRLVTPYADGRPDPIRMTSGISIPLWDTAALFAPERILDSASYPSGGAGMAGSATDVLTFLEAIRKGGQPILKPETISTMMQDHVGMQAETQGPGWGFGYGWAVLGDPAANGTPQAKGTIQWGGAYGHNWFVDPENELSVVSMTNTTFEGMNGPFVAELRDAVYANIGLISPTQSVLTIT